MNTFSLKIPAPHFIQLLDFGCGDLPTTSLFRLFFPTNQSSSCVVNFHGICILVCCQELQEYRSFLSDQYICFNKECFGKKSPF